MKILVAVKRVPDYQAKVKIAPSGTSIVTDTIKWIVNPFDEIAVEEAVRLKEQGLATEVSVVCIGPDDAQQQLRYCLAMGADDAVLVQDTTNCDSFVAAQVLAALYKKGNYGLILLGKQSIDSDRNQTAQMVAELLELPQACFASKIEISGAVAEVEREVDGGIERVRLPMPAVISTDLRLNEPRYASLPNIMKAKKKPLEIVPLTSLVSDVTPKVTVLKFEPPAPRKAGRKVASVADLVTALRDEVKVI
jgi:electron transfer flavoprotein beta subunit